MALNSDQLAKLQTVVSDRPSKWRENAIFRATNEDWLKNSQSVAFIILEALSGQKITQKDLAEKLGVSPQQVNKWVKGKENFTFETIAKIEKALNIKIMTIGDIEIKTTKKMPENITVAY